MTQFFLSLKSTSFKDLQKHWFWRAVFFPFLLIRFTLIMVIYFAQIFPVWNVATQRGWNSQLKQFFTVWANWDSAWYVSIIKEGYHLDGPILTTTSNIAFYPLYPYLVKILSWPIYHFYPKDIVLLATGIVLSNIFFIAGMFMLYKLVILLYQDVDLAKKSILYLLLFPSAFFFSCFYTESTFLFLVISTFYFAKKEHWFLSGLMAAFLSLARPMGVLVVIPLAILYLQAIHWNLSRIRLNVLWIGLAPLALLTYMASLFPITGDFLAIFHIQAAWGKHFTDPLTTIFNPAWKYSQGIREIDRTFLTIFLILGVVYLFNPRSIDFGIYILLSLVPVLFSGQTASLTRYCSVLFPGFILLGKWGRYEIVHKVIMLAFYTLQIIFLIAWTRSYWVQ